MAASALRAVRMLLAFAPAAALIAGCADSDAPDDVVHPVRADGVARVTNVEDALAGAHLPTLDPATLDEAQIREVLGPGARCDFHYTAAGKPVLAMRTGPGDAVEAALVGLNGHLVRLEGAPVTPSDEGGGRLAMVAGPVRIAIAPDAPLAAAVRQHVAATVVFEVGASLRAGYRGYLRCAPRPAGEDAAG